MVANIGPHRLDGGAVVVAAGGAVQLGQADQVPSQLIGLAGGNLRRVDTGQAAVQQRQFRVRLGLRKNPFGQRQIARLFGHHEQLDDGVEQHGGGHAVVVAQRGDVDVALDQAAPAQITDAPGRGQITRLGQRGVRCQQAQQQIAVRPDVPGAQGRRAVPAQRLGRLFDHEAARGRVGAEVAVRVLQADEVVGHATQGVGESRVLRLLDGLGRGAQPLASVLAVPVAFDIVQHPLGVENGDGRAVRAGDEMAQPAALVGGECAAEDAAEFDLHAAARSASTTQRKPMPPERSLQGAINKYLPCWSSRYACGKYQCEVCG